MKARRNAALGLALVAALLVPGRAGADPITSAPADDDPTLRPVEHLRRGGVVLGASAGLGFAGASGYPNNARFLNNPDYYSESPLLVGWSSTFFLMGALTDWFSFGPSVTLGNFENKAWKSTGFGIGFRSEVFPLLRLVPRLADVALYGQLGVGSTELRAKGPYPTADGSASFFGIGVHDEWPIAHFLGAHAAVGPYIEYNAVVSQPAERHWLAAGFRAAFYSSGEKGKR